MKLFVYALVMGALILPADTMADNSGWYMAIDAGQSHFNDVANQAPQWFVGFDPGVSPLSTQTNYTDNDIGYRLAAGYQFDDYWGVEAGYVNLGQATYNYNDVYSGSGLFVCGMSCMNNYNAHGTLKDQGWSLVITGAYPLNQHWMAFARAGAFNGRMELEDLAIPIVTSGYGNTSIPDNTSRTGTNTNPAYGIGVKYLFLDNLAVRLAWDRYLNLHVDSRTGIYDIDLLSLGIVYEF